MKPSRPTSSCLRDRAPVGWPSLVPSGSRLSLSKTTSSVEDAPAESSGRRLATSRPPPRANTPLAGWIAGERGIVVLTTFGEAAAIDIDSGQVVERRALFAPGVIPRFLGEIQVRLVGTALSVRDGTRLYLSLGAPMSPDPLSRLVEIDLLAGTTRTVMDGDVRDVRVDGRRLFVLIGARELVELDRETGAVAGRAFLPRDVYAITATYTPR